MILDDWHKCSGPWQADLIIAPLFLTKKVKSKILSIISAAIVHILHIYCEPIVKLLQW